MYFKAGINFEIFLKKIYFASLRTLNSSIILFVNPFVDIALTFLDSSFNSFLLDVKFCIWLLKSVVFVKLSITVLLAKFTSFDLEANFSDVNLLILQ